MHEAQYGLENDTHKIIWDFEIKTITEFQLDDQTEW